MTPSAIGVGPQCGIQNIARTWMSRHTLLLPFSDKRDNIQEKPVCAWLIEVSSIDKVYINLICER